MDTIHRFLFEDLDIRGALVRLGPAWRAMTAGRGYAPVVRELLGELAAVSAIIGSNLKTPGRLTFQVQGHGAVSLLVVDCDERLRLRGAARAPADLAPMPVPHLLGDGQLVLSLQTHATGAAQQPYQSYVPLEGETLAAIFEHYLAQSEQTPARLWLAADGENACGLFLQKLPETDQCDPDGWNRVQQLAATVRPEELALPAETLLGRLFPEETIRLFAPGPVSYHSPRDEAKVLDMLRALGREELRSILAERGEIHIHDEIGNHEYRFGPDVLDLLFPPPTLH
ncbi:molecular chaperone Hsp33 [Denitratisoma sp. DHT3]|uniref:Hsp33 family molecular chaperone HslO n=1 Tax=Denitratisoma sp. DHT3 TaxID=1981880 RepID=UPI0011984321|nr:Hsp33 family molecular chaperone HslO [Denitratisoma sp. DHT3]QDX80641.1 molecular chaperone Hsp33 [Denitratisoma sp. DHT3]